MAEFNMSAYDRLDQCRAEIAFMRAALGHMEDINLDKEPTFGLFLILSRAEDVLDDFLAADEKVGQDESQEEAAHD